MLNFSWGEPNSNMSPPKLSLDSLLRQTPNWGRVEPINWITSEKKFSPEQAKRALSYKFYIYQFSLSDMKIDVSHAETILQCSIRPKQTDRTSWTIQTHSDELNRARRRTFHEVNSQVWFLS